MTPLIEFVRDLRDGAVGRLLDAVERSGGRPTLLLLHSLLDDRTWFCPLPDAEPIDDAVAEAVISGAPAPAPSKWAYQLATGAWEVTNARYGTWDEARRALGLRFRPDLGVVRIPGSELEVESSSELSVDGPASTDAGVEADGDEPSELNVLDGEGA
jgi:hypothetical protein